MHRSLCCISIVLLFGGSIACSIQEDTGLKSPAPTNEVSSAVNDELVLSDDGIVAPSAPTLSISALPGALNFKWVDQRTNAKRITHTRLYQYNNKTDQEIEISDSISPDDLKFTLTIAPHRFAWDALSFRVELCSNDDCVSSSRVPVDTLLNSAVTTFTPTNRDSRASFGDDIAINEHGNLAVASSPAMASATVLFYLDHQWIELSTLQSQHFSPALDANMRVSMSASGDTIAVASISKSASPAIVIFDRLGENWIETDIIAPMTTSASAQSWDTASMRIQLADNGDRLLFAAQPSRLSVNAFDNKLNQIAIFDRNNLAWARTANLEVPRQHTLLRSTSASAAITSVLALSVMNGALYLHDFSLSNNQWQAASQLLDSVNASIDTQVVSSTDASLVGIAGWEQDSDGRRSAVAWKFEKSADTFVPIDSIRLPPTEQQSANLRLAADDQLQSLAIGWQAQGHANLAFYKVTDQQLRHQFSVPGGFGLNQMVPLAQSVVISGDSSTALIGTTKTISGGMLSSFR